MRIQGTIDLTISSLRVECWGWEVKRPDGLRPLAAALIRFEGTYGGGSAGFNDALFMRWRISELFELRSPSALVADLRELAYEWGDDLWVGANDASVPVYIVIREDRRTAFAGVLGQDRLRTDMEATLDEVDAVLRARRPEKKPPAKNYDWTEVWLPSDPKRSMVIVRGADDGTIDLFDPLRRLVPFESFPSEPKALDALHSRGFARVEGRRPKETIR